MKKLILAALLLMPAAAMAENKVMVCDASLIAGLGEEPTASLGFIPKGATVADNGISFQIVQGGNVLTSPPMKVFKPGVLKGVNIRGEVFIKRGGSYQVSADGAQWLYYDNCKPAGKGI